MQRSNHLPAITLGASDFSRLDQLASAAEYKLPDVAAFLGQELERARVVPPREVASDIVTMGSRVVFKDDAGEMHDVTLVYPEDADIERGKLSVLTPVGASLIGLKVGQSIQWRTRSGEERTLDVLEVAQRETSAKELG
ncbi:MAG: nucleoside diphosphate kinase regulator [Alphaproteobacteria bacterium]|nr:nucleoside diphosphate kinase regulator [Alphaproteobacteria bacterium]